MKVFVAGTFALWLLVFALGACVPTGDLLGLNAPGSAQVSYGVASGDISGFDLAAFSTRYVEAVRSGGGVTVDIPEGDGGRSLRLTLSPGATDCALRSAGRFGAAPGASCTLFYEQERSGGLSPLEALVRSGSVRVRQQGDALEFSLEALLETPGGGSFPLRVRGRSLIAAP